MRRVGGLILAKLAALASGPVQAAPLDEAIGLVLAASPTVAARESEAAAVARQSDWTSHVRLGYVQQATQLEAAGLNAGISVEIPLFSRKREIEAARARHAAAEARQALRGAFLTEVEGLVGLAAERAEAVELAALQRDRLAYFRQAVEEGRADSDALWVDAERARQAEHAAHRAAAKLSAALETTARRFGGSQWTRLQALLAAHANVSRP